MAEESSIPSGGNGNQAPPGNVRFGTFEVDLRAGELRKNGLKVRLHGQPFAVLAYLLEQPGKLVTREELQQKLWASDTFVDFEHGLNKAINKVREALGDNADNPRYVETLPRRGYRFIATVATAPADAVAAESGGVKTNEPRRGPWRVALGFAALAVLVGFGFYRIVSNRSPKVLAYRRLTSDRQAKGGTPCGGLTPLLTDGPRLFFGEPGAALAQVSTSGGEVVKLALPFPCFALSAISPDKSQLLGSLEAGGVFDQPLWTVSVLNGQAQRLGNLVGHSAVWSPDGRKIAYATGSDVDGSSDLHIAASDGSQSQKRHTFDKGRIGAIQWSPDGKILRISLLQSAFCTLWELDANGGNARQTDLGTGFSPPVCHPVWTPDGRYSVFARYEPSSGMQLWSVREGATRLSGRSRAVPLTSGAMGFWNAAPSLDGKQIYAIGGETRGALLRYDIQAARQEPFLSGISAEHLDFSRDGKWVAYITYPEAVLWKSSLDGKDRMQLTVPPLFVVLPQWSPDGTRITFTGQRPGEHWKIYVISAEGGDPQVVAEDQSDLVQSTWAAGGSSVTYGRSQYALAPTISTVDLATRRASAVPGSQGFHSPRESPDGRFIVAQDRSSRLRLFDRQSGKWTAMTDARHPGLGWVRWSSDGRSVYGTAMILGTKRYELYRVGLENRQPVRVAALEVPEGTTGSWGSWVGITPDGSPLLLRDLSIYEIYALDVNLP